MVIFLPLGIKVDGSLFSNVLRYLKFSNAEIYHNRTLTVVLTFDRKIAFCIHLQQMVVHNISWW